MDGFFIDLLFHFIVARINRRSAQSMETLRLLCYGSQHFENRQLSFSDTSPFDQLQRILCLHHFRRVTFRASWTSQFGHIPFHLTPRQKMNGPCMHSSSRKKMTFKEVKKIVKNLYKYICIDGYAKRVDSNLCECSTRTR